MTTLRTNVGDDFIREGIRSLLDELLQSYHAFYVNKHDLRTLSSRQEDEEETLADKFREADVIIQAGAPVYWRLGPSTCYNVEWARALWFDRIFRLGPEKCILNVAAGSCQPYPGDPGEILGDPDCVDFIRRVSTACRWTSVRDPLAGKTLESLDLPAVPLPCAAFHAARRHPSRGGDEPRHGPLVVNLMPRAGHYILRDDVRPDTWRALLDRLVPALRRLRPLRFVAHDAEEEAFMARWRAPGEDLFLSPRWQDYLPVYASSAAVFANRVHGAVCAAGFGRPAVIVGNDSRLRIGEYIGLPVRYVADATAEEIETLAAEALRGAPRERDRLLGLREESAGRYREGMRQHLAGIPGLRNA